MNADIANNPAIQESIIPRSDLRAMRDMVYGRPICDIGWASCREHWAKDEKWLREQVEKMTAKNAKNAKGRI